MGDRVLRRGAGGPPMSLDLPQSLRRVRELVAPSATPGRSGSALARSAADRLDRDLLPRTAGSHEHLVVGIVGPNNAGKSALFNALVGAARSPSLPTGGATRRLLGAASPELAARLAGEPTLAQFPLRRVAAEGEVRDALEHGADPAELLLVEMSTLPPRLLLIDTPDFDSILADNRLASESLLKVCDLAIVVVTRHTYQNRDVVTFLERWLAHGRPWMLVYNESLSAATTAQHAAKLAADLESSPVAVFHAPFDLAVAEGRRPLEPHALDDSGEPIGLSEWLFDLHRSRELKERALAASLSQLTDDLRALVGELAADARDARERLQRGRDLALRLGRGVAGRAMPMEPFLEAFRAVLDRRPTPFQRSLRSALRRSRLVLEGLWARLPFASRRRSVPEERDVALVEVERRALAAGWPVFFEELLTALAPRPGEVDRELLEPLAADLVPERSEPARALALAAVADDPEVRDAFQAACEERIEAELERRGNEWFFQIAVDALHVFPAVAAGIVIFKTGGLGTDVAVGGAGALSSLLAERLSRLLGTQVARDARERWMELRGGRLAEAVLGACLERSAPLLEERVTTRAELARELEETMEAFPCGTTTTV